jgi:hypothetical protein
MTVIPEEWFEQVLGFGYEYFGTTTNRKGTEVLNMPQK